MRMSNDLGQVVYYNCVEKQGNVRYVIKAASGQVLRGRDGQRRKSRTFAQEHQAAAFLKRHGYQA